MLILCNEKTGVLDPFALHWTGRQQFKEFDAPFNPVGMPAAEVLATGKPVVAYDFDIDRYSSPVFRRAVEMGCKSICSVPLISRDRTLGTLALVRTTDNPWTPDDVEFLVQVANQIAIAVENSLAYRELTEIKERLATEKLYLEDEIRLDHNVGNMVGNGPAFQSISKSIRSLYAHANEFDIAKAKAFQVEWTPRGWMRPDLDLLGFEQQLYLRQPGYGTSYVTGKHLLDEIMKDRSHQLGAAFNTSRYFAEVNAAGMIPVSLIRWQITGLGDEIQALQAE